MIQLRLMTLIASLILSATLHASTQFIIYNNNALPIKE